LKKGGQLLLLMGGLSYGGNSHIFWGQQSGGNWGICQRGRSLPSLYQKYGEVLQLDGTHNITQLAMPLYTLLVQDNFGVGQPVAFFL
jgi:hypothetical protein